jgi:hypothetical protein
VRRTVGAGSSAVGPLCSIESDTTKGACALTDWVNTVHEGTGATLLDKERVRLGLITTTDVFFCFLLLFFFLSLVVAGSTLIFFASLVSSNASVSETAPVSETALLF